MQEYTVFFKYLNTYDLCVVKANSNAQAIANAQNYFNNNAAYADVAVTVYKATCNA